MKNVIAFLFAVVLLAACGGDSNPGTPAPQPPPGGGGSPGAKWTAQEFQTYSNKCAQAGVRIHPTRGNQQQWLNYCRCIYSVVSQRWTVQEFAQGYDQIFPTLSAQDAACYQSSGVKPN